MKKSIVRILTLTAAAAWLSGCAWQIGDSAKQSGMQPTVGQQLMDLQKAKDCGALTESEYQAQKAKVLGNK